MPRRKVPKLSGADTVVRWGLRAAAGVCQLLMRCRLTLTPCSELLLELAFTLAADSWPAVAAPPRAWLAQVPRPRSCSLCGLHYFLP